MCALWRRDSLLYFYYCTLTEILRVSGMISDQGFSDYDRLLRGSPSHVASRDIIQSVGGKALGGWKENDWNSFQPEVSTCHA